MAIPKWYFSAQEVFGEVRCFNSLCLAFMFWIHIWKAALWGPQTARLCDEIRRTFQIWRIFAGHRKTQRKNNSTKTHDNYWKTTFHLLSIFSYVVFQKIPIILFYQLFGKQKTPGSPGIYMTLRISSPPMEVCPVWFNSQVDQNIYVNEQNLPSRITSRLSSLNKLTSKSEPTIQFQTVTCLVSSVLSHALTCTEVCFFQHPQKNKLRELEL